MKEEKNKLIDEGKYEIDWSGMLGRKHITFHPVIKR